MFFVYVNFMHAADKIYVSWNYFVINMSVMSSTAASNELTWYL